MNPNNFGGKSPVDPADTLQVKKFRQNQSISLSVRDKHVSCVLRRNSKWPPKVAGKRFLGKVASRLCRYPVGKKFLRNRSVSEINAFLHFAQKFKMAAKVAGKQF